MEKTEFLKLVEAALDAVYKVESAAKECEGLEIVEIQEGGKR